MKELKEFDYFKAWLLFFLIATVGWPAPDHAFHDQHISTAVDARSR
jgi:hypothetical protein